jgi:hypothetical protein
MVEVEDMRIIIYPQEPGPGAYDNGYNAGISDAVYDHDNDLAYNLAGQCLPCHSEVGRITYGVREFMGNIIYNSTSRQLIIFHAT